MYNYVSELAADYTEPELTISPQKVMTEIADMKQAAHEYDDGSMDVVTFSDTVYFNVTLQWTGITAADAATILNFYATTAKANGRERTFYITLPDTYTYTVRFMGPLKRVSTVNLFAAGYRGIAQLTLRVEGKKPA